MKEIRDKNLLSYYLNKFKVYDYFDTPNLDFRLYEYETGEIISFLHSSKNYLKFMVKGSIRVYYLREDGNMFVIYQGNDQGLIGDFEFLINNDNKQYHEALTTLHSIELFLPPIKETLLDDKKFLRYLLNQISQRYSDFQNISIYHHTTVETQILHYLEQSPNHSLNGIEAMAFYLKCSRSQIQRALKSLIQKDKIKKIGKGQYKLIIFILMAMLEHLITYCNAFS